MRGGPTSPASVGNDPRETDAAAGVTAGAPAARTPHSGAGRLRSTVTGATPGSNPSLSPLEKGPFYPKSGIRLPPRARAPMLGRQAP